MDEDDTPRESVSSGHFSVDQQVADVVAQLDDETRARFLAAFPEWERLTWGMHGSWVDTDASGVDVEYVMWACDWLEQETPVWWEDGEPWVPA